MKRILAFICTIMLVLSIGILPASAAGSGTLSVTGATGKQGEAVTLSVKLNSNPGLISMKFTVSYPADLELTGVQNSGTLGGWTTPAPTVSSPYTIRWADSLATANSTATGTLVTLTFKIKDTATPGAKTVSIHFTESRDVDGNKLSFNSPSATVQVNCKTHSFGENASLNDTQHGKTCSACGYVEKASHSWDSGKVTANPSCKEEGEKTYTCSVCNGTKIETIARLAHTYDAWSKADDNNHVHTCSACGKSETASHTWDNGKITKAATCKEEGVRTYTCSACKATKTEVIPKTETHKYGAWKKVDDTTHERVCSVCDKKETGNHSYGAKWSKDKNQHYHECSVCKDKKDAQDHIPGPEATEKTPQTCTVCSYVIKAALEHKHNYADTWESDETGHWYVCSGCEEKGSYAEHDFQNICDPDCSVCGYTRETSHSFIMQSDETNHWNECEGCGLKEGEEAHIPGAEATEETAQACTVCGYEIAPELGAAEPTETQPEATEAPQEDSDPSSEFPWWIVIAAVAVLAIAVAVIVIRKKENR